MVLYLTKIFLIFHSFPIVTFYVRVFLTPAARLCRPPTAVSRSRAARSRPSAHKPPSFECRPEEPISIIELFTEEPPRACSKSWSGSGDLDPFACSPESECLGPEERNQAMRRGFIFNFEVRFEERPRPKRRRDL